MTCKKGGTADPSRYGARDDSIGGARFGQATPRGRRDSSAAAGRRHDAQTARHSGLRMTRPDADHFLGLTLRLVFAYTAGGRCSEVKRR